MAAQRPPAARQTGSPTKFPELLRNLDPEAVKTRLSGIDLPLGAGGASWETIEAHFAKVDLRGQVSLLTDLLAANGAGILITLDEVHRRHIDGIRELVTVVQHAFREERELAFVAAGLSSSISDLLSDDVLTFLRRAERHHLGAVELDDVRTALEEPITRSGRGVEEQALDLMTEATRGYPFLIQLVGSRCWKETRDRDVIDLSAANRGIEAARRRLGSLVHAPALGDASDIDKSFLVAMAQDDGPSAIADIRARLGGNSQYVGVYRQRLIDAELIQPAGRGRVDFALPYLRDYLREHVTANLHG